MPIIGAKGAQSSQGFGQFTTGGGGGGGGSAYVEDVFSTYLYLGTSIGGNQIVNGVDLADYGGMLWSKSRNYGAGADGCVQVVDTVRGLDKPLFAGTNQPNPYSPNLYLSVNTDGYTLGNGGANIQDTYYAGWTFRKQAKFFDIVTWTGNSVAGRTISHNLGSTPGCILVKCTSNNQDWAVYHTSLGPTKGAALNLTDVPVTSSAYWNDTAPTSTQFTVGNSADTNYIGYTYVAYLFASDAGGFGESGNESIIKCGSYTASSGFASVNLGWEPQWLLTKNINGASNWSVRDVTRNWAKNSLSYVKLNTYDVESTITPADNISLGYPKQNGFVEYSASGTNIYVAIRRGPMKKPTDATKVFMPTVYTGTNADNRLVNTTIAPDMILARRRNASNIAGMVLATRPGGDFWYLTGTLASTRVYQANAMDQQYISTFTTGQYGGSFTSMNGFWVGNYTTDFSLNASTTANNQVALAFKRAPGFFDMVAYFGTGSVQTIPHNLGVVPELIIYYNALGYWITYAASVGNTKYLQLNSDALPVTDSTYWNNTSPTSTEYTVGTNNVVNFNGQTFFAMLFATCPGVSKVGSYVGNGTSQTIDCGFTGGARFVLVRTISSVSHWCLFDTARGMTAGTDPSLFPSSTSAEINSTYVYSVAPGFQLPTSNVNANGETYIYLAVA